MYEGEVQMAVMPLRVGVIECSVWFPTFCPRQSTRQEVMRTLVDSAHGLI